MVRHASPHPFVNTNVKNYTLLAFILSSVILVGTSHGQTLEALRHCDLRLQLRCHTGGEQYSRPENAQIAVVSDTTFYVSMPSRRRAVLIDTTGRLLDTLEFGQEIDVIAMRYSPTDSVLHIVSKNFYRKRAPIVVYKVCSGKRTEKVKTLSESRFLEAYALAGIILEKDVPRLRRCIRKISNEYHEIGASSSWMRTVAWRYNPEYEISARISDSVYFMGRVGLVYPTTVTEAELRNTANPYSCGVLDASTCDINKFFAYKDGRQTRVECDRGIYPVDRDKVHHLSISYSAQCKTILFLHTTSYGQFLSVHYVK